MSRTTAVPAADSVSAAIARSSLVAGRRPVPLVATEYDIQITGGLAVIIARRTFRNVERASIEATLTFPLPIHAVLYALEARIGDRVLVARASAKPEARAAYESAIDRGKTAVLHEELIRGIHLLSIGHIAPGTEIVVTVRLAVPLSHVDGRTFLRVPMTVGDVYGEAGLPDSDVPVHEPSEQAVGELKLRCDCGAAVLRGGNLVDGRARIGLDCPLVIEIETWEPCMLGGSAADGRSVMLDIRPAPRGSGAIDAVVLVDRSGSMGEPAAGDAGLDKHAAAVAGLVEAASHFTTDDRLELWEFNDSVRLIGRGSIGNWHELVHQLSGPSGGTEIGRAIETVIRNSGARDILLITDGKSYAIDVQLLAATGRRVTVVLIGEDSLEANVGHLAILTGGDILVPQGSQVSGAVRGALHAIRLSGDPRESTMRSCGMALAACWKARAASSKAQDPVLARAVGAFAASLMLPSLTRGDACKLAEAEGLVTHFTSLVLVDEDGSAQAGLPGTRKVALPSPRTVARFSPALVDADILESRASFSHGRSKKVIVVDRSRSTGMPKRSAPPAPYVMASKAIAAPPSVTPEPAPATPRTPQPSPHKLSRVVGRIDWTRLGTTLATGDLVGVDADLADLMREASDLTQVRKAAKRVGVAPLLLVIALMARHVAAHDRHADRVARAILGKALPKHLMHATDQLGLSTGAVPAG